MAIQQIGRLVQVSKLFTETNAAWPVPANIARSGLNDAVMIADLCGGGGGGGGGYTGGGGGGGGSGGQAIAGFQFAVAPGDVLAITVGEGGAKGIGGVSPTDGTVGGYSIVTSSTYGEVVRAHRGVKGIAGGAANGGAGGYAQLMNSNTLAGGTGGATGNGVAGTTAVGGGGLGIMTPVSGMFSGCPGGGGAGTTGTAGGNASPLRAIQTLGGTGTASGGCGGASYWSTYMTQYRLGGSPGAAAPVLSVGTHGYGHGGGGGAAGYDGADGLQGFVRLYWWEWVV